MDTSAIIKTLFSALVFSAILFTGFFVGRQLVDTKAQADDPLTTETILGSTPEWYAPSLATEAAADRFQGKVNGITLGVEDGPLPTCDRTEIQSDVSSLTGTAFDIGIGRLPPGTTLQTPPRIGVCADDGRIIWVIAQLILRPQPGVNGDVGVVQVSRWENVRWYKQQFLADRVHADEVEGRPAVRAERGASGFGEAAVIVVDDAIAGSTMLISTNVDSSILLQIARGMYR